MVFGASNGSAVSGAVDSDLFFSHGGVLGPSSSTVSKVPAVIFVVPPSAFSPKKVDIWTVFTSMSSRSWTLPKSPRLASNAPEKRLVPTALPSCRPFACWNSKSASYGPRVNDWPSPSNENVQSPSLNLNANENERVRPGPIEDTPEVGSNLPPRLVAISALIPPIGIADSLVKFSNTSTISSSSSSISIRTDCRVTESEPAVAECS